MLSSNRYWAAGLAVVLLASRAFAQQQAQGFSVERLYPSAAGGGWFVMDELNMQGGLSGAMQFTVGYARNPLRISDGVNRISVVSDQLSADFGAAITYDRWRFYLNVGLPFVITGQNATVGAYAFTAPSLDPGSLPDPVSDVRVGSDVRIVGKPGGPFRFGAGAQLFLPSGKRSDYVTDDTFRGMVRALVAGDAGDFTYAGHLGVHIRPLDDSPVPGSPRGSELIFGAAAGPRLPIGSSSSWALVIGPEIYGATAFRSFLKSTDTALEGLLSGRIEGTRVGALQLRIRLGIGAGLNQRLGAPEWRLVVGIEMFNHNAHPPSTSEGLTSPRAP